MVRGRIAVCVCTALVASGVALGGGVAAAADKNCGDFTSQAQAQAYFVANGGSPANNVNNLDSDHNGVACQAHPYGSSTSPSSGSGQATSSTGTASTGSSSTGTSSGGSTAGTASPGVPSGALPAAQPVPVPAVSGGTDRNCRDFASQAAAQAFLLQNPADPSRLDGDHDGMACDDYFGATGAGSSTRDDGSRAAISGNQVRLVPEGSANTGSW